MADEKEFDCITCSQLVTRMAAKQARMSRADIKMAVRVSLEHMSEVLSRGQRIEVRGFGSFSLRFRKPRMTRNPKTRKTVFISGRSLPYFKPSALLLARVNKEVRGYGPLVPGPDAAAANTAPAAGTPPDSHPQPQAADAATPPMDAQGAQMDGAAQTNAGAPAAMNADADAARGGMDEGRDETVSPPPERDSGAV